LRPLLTQSDKNLLNLLPHRETDLKVEPSPKLNNIKSIPSIAQEQVANSPSVTTTMLKTWLSNNIKFKPSLVQELVVNLPSETTTMLKRICQSNNTKSELSTVQVLVVNSLSVTTTVLKTSQLNNTTLEPSTAQVLAETLFSEITTASMLKTFQSKVLMLLETTSTLDQATK
jgi:hypothetical protein